MFDFGILGMNARNLLYIKKFNHKKSIFLADSKIKTKTYLSARGFPFAETFAIIQSRTELQDWNMNILPKHFVVKPNEGSKGNDILVLERRGDMFFSSDRDYSEAELTAHMIGILDGAFSISGRYDECSERCRRRQSEGITYQAQRLEDTQKTPPIGGVFINILLQA